MVSFPPSQSRIEALVLNNKDGNEHGIYAEISISKIEDVTGERQTLVENQVGTSILVFVPRTLAPLNRGDQYSGYITRTGGGQYVLQGSEE